MSTPTPLEQSYQLSKPLPLDEPENDSSYRECISTMDEKIMKEENKLPATFYSKWIKAAFVIEYLSILITISLSVSSFILSSDTISSSLFAFSFDTLLALISSACIIWRFSNETNKRSASKEDEFNLQNDKERKACYVIGGAFAVTAIIIFVDAILSILQGNHLKHTSKMLIISFCSFILLGILFYAKFTVAQKLKSRAMKTDAVDSAAGALTAFSIIISTFAVKADHSDLWFLDEAIAIVIGIATFIYGIQTIVLAWQAGPNTPK